MPENEDSEIETRLCCCCCCAKVSKRAKQLLHFKSPKSKVPFSGDLPKDFTDGTVIHVKGTILPHCSRFAIDLTCGHRSESCDIAFHFNPRLLQRYVVRNSKLNGQWGEEESTTHSTKFNLERGEQFHISIHVLKDSFGVAVNGEFFCSFAMRVPLKAVKGLIISGCVEIESVEYEQSLGFQSTKTVVVEKRQQKEDIGEEEDEAVFQDTPLTVLLPQGFQQGWQLEIYGRVKILPHSFYVNLQEGSQQWPHPTVALHLNPRFGQALFVRNAWIQNEGWGAEERTPGFLFSPGSPFLMVIRRANDHFSVWIDGKLVGEFKFRTDPDQIDTLYIHGDLRIRKVILEQEPTNLLNLSTQNLNFNK